MENLSLDGLTVLVVEDEVLLAEIVCSDLKDMGASVMMAVNGKDAMKILKTQEIDLIVTDQSMPGMTGLQLAEEVRNSDYYKNENLILLTGYDREDIAIKAPTLIDHITVVNKPIDHEQLERAIARCVNVNVNVS